MLARWFGRVTVVLGAVGGLVAPTSAVPAQETVIESVSGGAFGLSVNLTIIGGPAVDLGPVPSVELPTPGGGPITDEIANLSEADLVFAELLGVETEGTGVGTPAGAATSSAQVVELAVLPEISLGDVIGLLTADAISSECTSDASGSTGSASLVEATVAETALDATPEPNTTIEVDLGVLGSITVVMNEQIVEGSGADSSITVNALRLTVDTTVVTGEVIVSQSRCGTVSAVLPPPPPPPVPVVVTPTFTG